MRRLFFSFFLAGVSLLVAESVLFAQPTNPVPGNRPSYPNARFGVALQVYRDGKFRDATEGFQDALRAGRTSPNGKWIDSIPAYAMLGECLYQNGDLALAHDHFDLALQVMVRGNDWISALQWPDQVAPLVARNNPSWGRRALLRAQVPPTIQLAQGTLDQISSIQRDGLLRGPEIIPIDAIEILRGLAVALYRRGEILGPLGQDDPLVKSLINSLNSSRFVAGPWPLPIRNTLLGLAHAVDGNREQAISTLQASLTLPGNLDHPLSPIARVALAKLFYQAGQPGPADQLIMDASVSAAMFGQAEWIAEAFSVGVGPMILRNQGAELFTAANSATVYMGRDFRGAAAHCSLIAAEIAIATGRVEDANRRLNEVIPLFTNKRPVGPPRLHAYGQLVRAQGLAGVGNINEALVAATTATNMVRGNAKSPSSTRLYQIALLTQSARSGKIGELTVEKRLQGLLEVNDPWLWSQDPLDGIALQSSDLELPLGLQLELEKRKGKDEALIGKLDALQRNALRQGLPLGGRWLDLQWFVASPELWLPDAARALRQKPTPAIEPMLAAERQTAAAIRAVRQVPWVDDPKSLAARRELFTKAEQAAQSTETLLLRASLSRVPTMELFPPVATTESIKREIPVDGAILAFSAVGDQVYGVWASKHEIKVWPVVSRSLPAQVQKLLLALQTNPDKVARELTTDWEKEMELISKILLPEAWRLPAEIKRMVFVPTGILWLIPLELLSARGADQERLGERCLCSYAPTMGLAVHPIPYGDDGGLSGFVANRFLLPKDAGRDMELVREIQQSLPGARPLSADVIGSGRMASAALQHVWILSGDRLEENVGDWSPLVYDRTLPGGRLSDWMRSPWVAPQTVLLPGLDLTNSPPYSLSQVGAGLHAAAVPSALISRWPVGGASTANVLKETLIDLPERGLLEAWYRARAIVRSQRWEGASEPILGVDAANKSADGNEPRFWASYFVLDGFRERPRLPDKTPSSVLPATPIPVPSPPAKDQ